MHGKHKWHAYFGVLGILVVLTLIVGCAQAPASPGPAPAKPAASDSPTSAEKAAPAKPAAETTAAPAPKAEPAKPAAPAPAAPKAAKPTGEAVIVLANLGAEKFDPSQDRPIVKSYQPGGPIFEPLYMPWPPDGDVRPFLLESGKAADDNMSWTFKLRDGIRFANGDPMTAEDLKFSLDRYRSEVSVSPMAGEFRQGIKNVVVVDRLTARVDLNNPMLGLPIYLSGQTGNEGVMLPKKYIEQVGWETFNRKPIGSGPYKMVEHKPGESITYEAVENHWRTTPTFAKVRYVAVPEERSRVAMLKAGQGDLVRIDPESKKEVEQAGFKSYTVPAEGMWQLNFYGAFGSYPPGPTSKVEVRKALDMAINKQEMLDSLYAGAGNVAAFAPVVPDSALGAPKDLKPSPYDPAQAKRLLQQAGYPNGFDLTFYAVPLPACSNVQQLAQAFASYWDRIGVKTQIKPMEYAVFRPLFAGKEHAQQIVGTVANHCAEGSPLALTDINIYYWSKGIVKLTDVADAEIEKAQTAKSVDEMVQNLETAYRKVYNNVPAIPILVGSTVYGASKQAADLPVIRGTDLFSMWLTQDRP